MKKSQAIENSVGGFDLLTERDSGNEVLILTGKPQFSKDYWHDLFCRSNEALDRMSAKPKNIVHSPSHLSKKKSEIKKNFAGGYDLLTERDGGNEVLILTGSKEHSKKFWRSINKLAKNVLADLSDKLM